MVKSSDEMFEDFFVEVLEHDERASSESEGGGGGPMSPNLLAPHDWAGRSSYLIHRRSQSLFPRSIKGNK